MWGATRLWIRRAAARSFQSTLPVWGATRYTHAFTILSCISIHAPRVGSDHNTPFASASYTNFNPRSPCGERLASANKIVALAEFQSTLPVWGATSIGMVMDLFLEISIHAPRVGSDVEQFMEVCGYGISIHAPRVGSDASAAPRLSSHGHFNPRSPCGERRRADRI